MRKRAMVPHLVLAAMLLMVTVVLSVGETGQITGQITDKETGDPIVGAQVLVEGTSSGAMSDSTGHYRIDRVAPGAYKLRITAVGYNALRVTDLVVKADSATRYRVHLEPAASDTSTTIEVKAKQDIIEKFEVANTTSVDRSSTANAPTPVVREMRTSVLQSMVNPQGQAHIRGGRADKVPYIIDGQPYPPAHGGNAIVNNEPFDAMFFDHHGTNPFVDTEDDHLSTFAIDVDDASYVMTRSYLNRGHLPPDEAVRTEEFVNHFDYDYALPERDAFAIHVEGAPSKFGPDNSLMLKIGIKGFAVAPEDRKAANLVFVVDVSGSMGREDRLGLVRKTLRLLIDELNADDRIGIVVYGSRGRVILQPTGMDRKSEIIAAVEQLVPTGSTNAEEGLRLGYEMADRMFEPGKINRVILCSDGVANVGRTGPDQLLEQIKEYAGQGITLSTIGFGMGNYNDVLMEKLGNKGNGHYAYVDNLPEARRIFVENLTGTLQVIARDVKIQVDFDTSVVRSYRLLGYENRDVRDEDFRVDTVDGGEIGSGHEVTALYEVKLHEKGEGDQLATVFVRYKDPDDMSEVTEVKQAVRKDAVAAQFDAASVDFRLAAASAEFAEILRKSYWAKESQLSAVQQLVQSILSERSAPEVIELLDLVSKASQFKEGLAEK